jgi:tRNA(Ile)-lysidine synthase TilS/MesJ
VYVPEEEILIYSAKAGFPVTCCACPACGDPDQKRVQIKKLLADLERAHPGIKANLLASLAHVDVRHLLARSNDAPLVTEGRAGGKTTRVTGQRRRFPRRDHSETV